MKRSASAAPCPSGCRSSAKRLGVGPRRLAVRAPVAAERPARQLFAGIPLALAEVHEAVRAVALSSAAAADRRRARAWSARARRCSTRRRRDRSPTRTSARRPSSGARRRRRGPRRPRARTRGSPPIASSVYGLVTRGDSTIRCTDIAWSNSTSHGSTPPVTGAALVGSGVHASGMCPSPASSPDVGSRPIQPAPGRYTSHQAWRSVKSRLGAGGPVERLDVRRQLDQIAGHEARREPEVAEQLHEQPRGVAARADASSSVRSTSARRDRAG